MLGDILRSLTNPAEAEAALLELGNALMLERVRADAQAGARQPELLPPRRCVMCSITGGKRSGSTFSARWLAHRSRVRPRSPSFSPRHYRTRRALSLSR